MLELSGWSVTEVSEVSATAKKEKDRTSYGSLV